MVILRTAGTVSAGGHRLGHRGDVENGVSGHGDARRLVAPAIGVQRHQLAMARDRNHRAGNPARFDIGFQNGADARQPLRGETDLFRLGPGQGIVGECSGGRNHETQNGCENSDGNHGRLPVRALRPFA
jgi:hypothetical protein